MPFFKIKFNYYAIKCDKLQLLSQNNKINKNYNYYGKIIKLTKITITFAK